jgi:hypothetical protein
VAGSTPSSGSTQRITYGLWVLLPGSGGRKIGQQGLHAPVDVVAEDPHRLQVVAWKVQLPVLSSVDFGSRGGWWRTDLRWRVLSQPKATR